MPAAKSNPMLTHGAIGCRHFVAGCTIVVIESYRESKTEFLKRNFKTHASGYHFPCNDDQGQFGDAALAKPELNLNGSGHR